MFARRSERTASTKLCEYVAHSMGSNAICLQELAAPRAGDLGAAGEGWRILACSGGDDQSLTCCLLRIDEDGAAVGLQCAVEASSRVAWASGSAIKGARLLADDRELAERVSGARVATIGYDQRLSLWDVRCDAAQWGEERRSAAAAHSESTGTKFDATAGDTGELSVSWLAGALANINDVCSLDISPSQSAATGSEQEHLCVVAGEGLEVLRVSATDLSTAAQRQRLQPTHST